MGKNGRLKNINSGKLFNFDFLKNEAGFTLTEVLMAVALLTTGIMAYGVLSGSLVEKNSFTKKESIAMTLAQDKIEEIRTAVYDRITLDSALIPDNPQWDGTNWVQTGGQVLDSEGETSGPLQYTRTWDILQADDSGADDIGSDGGGNNLFDVVVTVSWVNNGNQSVTLDSRISQ